MRVVIFGAAGKTGGLLVDPALAKGYEVTVKSSPDYSPSDQLTAGGRLPGRATPILDIPGEGR